MHVGPAAGLAGSAAGAPLSQSGSASTERAAGDGAAAKRADEAQTKAEDAAGIGHAEEDQQASDRDADGRRLWEPGPEAENDDPQPPDEPKAKDPAGIRGAALDLTG